MIKTVAVVSVAALALAAASRFPGLRDRSPSEVPTSTAAATDAVVAPPIQPQSAAKPLSRREQMARLVAETAAATADQAARRALAEKSPAQQTASR
jgi:hypothetical protein